jgi:dTDP-4-dehydrorhamnose reductase
MEAARRYHLPIALTEVHIGCADEEEQVRWLHDAWTICEQLAASGVPIHAVTAWALFGSYDWDTMMTRGGNTYESGAFCLRSGTPRPTRIAEYIRTRTGRSAERMAVDARRGWWHRPERLLYGPGLPCIPSGTLRDNTPHTFPARTTAREARA